MRIVPATVYLLVGLAAAVWLTKATGDVAPTWLWLVVPMLLFALFFAVMGGVNLWLRLTDGYQPLSSRDVATLYLKVWASIATGLALAITARWMFGLLGESVRLLVPWLEPTFYVCCAALTVAATVGVLRGRRLHQIRLLGTQIENQLLKSQLNPHFLYNTLNNIDALVWIDQQRASEAMTSLSALMRYLTYSGRQQRVTLDEEVRHLEQLVALERLRLPRPEAIVLDVRMAQPKASIAPLLLMPLVENCFKHCGPLGDDGAIRMELSVAEGVLTFTTRNPLPEATPSAAAGQGGVGLSVLRRRLALLYPDRSELVAAPDGAGHYVARLTVRL